MSLNQSHSLRSFVLPFVCSFFFLFTFPLKSFAEFAEIPADYEFCGEDGVWCCENKLCGNPDDPSFDPATQVICVDEDRDEDVGSTTCFEGEEGSRCSIDDAIAAANRLSASTVSICVDSLNVRPVTPSFLITKTIVLFGGDAQGFNSKTINAISMNEEQPAFSISASGTLKLQNLKLESSLNRNNGGCIYNQGQLETSLTIFSRCRATESSSEGGAIFSTPDSLTSISQTSFIDNEAIRGAAVASAGQLIIDRSAFLGNRFNSLTASIRGGALFLANGNRTIIQHSTFVNNGDVRSRPPVSASAYQGQGGAIFISDTSSENPSQVIIKHSTISDNFSFFAGDIGIYYNASTDETAPSTGYLALSDSFVDNSLVDESVGCFGNGSAQIQLYGTNFISPISNDCADNLEAPELVDLPESPLVPYRTGVIDTYYPEYFSRNLPSFQFVRINTSRSGRENAQIFEASPMSFISWNDEDQLIQSCSGFDQFGNRLGTPCYIGATQFVCGDGILQKPEECEDGNSETGDGCDQLCKIEDTGTPTDDDSDGFTEADGDCNDANATIYPEAPEVCDGLDNNCNGATDEDLLTIYYRDSDGDGFGLNSLAVAREACSAPTGFVEDNTDCNDTNSTIYPGAPEICDLRDNNCDGESDEGLERATYYRDADSDGYGRSDLTSEICSLPDGSLPTDAYVVATGDCDDMLSDVNPGATEVCDGVDNNCNGETDEGFDADGDGFTTCAGDCDDSAADTYPGAPEICDTRNNDCDDETDEGVLLTFYRDADEDSFGDPSNSVSVCSLPAGYSENNEDCDDSNAAINPSATEVCDDVDNNCNGTLDEGFVVSRYYPDNDGDGFGDGGSYIEFCGPLENFTALIDGDCDDSIATTYPGAEEICDGIDSNCDGIADQDLEITFYRDDDGDGAGVDADGTTITACELPTGYATVANDCDDDNPNNSPLLSETCDGADNNCDGDIDEGVLSTFYRDADSDGYGILEDTVLGCVAPAGYVARPADCNDGNNEINPGVGELCDEIDNNCNGDIDEDNVCASTGPDVGGTDGEGDGSTETPPTETEPGSGSGSSNSADSGGGCSLNQATATSSSFGLLIAIALFSLSLLTHRRKIATQ